MKFKKMRYPKNYCIFGFKIKDSSSLIIKLYKQMSCSFGENPNSSFLTKRFQLENYLKEETNEENLIDFCSKKVYSYYLNYYTYPDFLFLGKYKIIMGDTNNITIGIDLLHVNDLGFVQFNKFNVEELKKSLTCLKKELKIFRKKEQIYSGNVDY